MAYSRRFDTLWISLVASVVVAGCGAAGDPALDVSTPPRVLSSFPVEGALDVPSGVIDVEIRFDRPMDGAIAEAPLQSGDQLATVSGSWRDATTITFAATVAPDATYQLDLRAFRDRAGRPIDVTHLLEDGFLDFGTVPDEAPYATASDPPEGAGDVYPLLRAVAVSFSEPMDARLTEVMLDRSGHPTEVASGVWSKDAQTLTVTFDHYLPTGTPLRLDVTGLADRAGNPVDATHPYLGDGALDFTLRKPDGDACSDPLVASQATIGNGFHSWYLPPRKAKRDGALACAASSGGDVVIAYDKTSGTLAEGGALMHLVAAGEAGPIALEVTSGACAGDVEKCMGGRDTWEAFLDVPAGRYWIWVATPEAALGAFSGAFVSVEEIPATAPQAQGEGCFAPFTTTSTSYEPPLGPDDPHVFVIPSADAFDAAPSTDAPKACGQTLLDTPSVDAVVEFPKMETSTVLHVEIDQPASLVRTEVRSGCDPRDPASVMQFCGVGASSFTVAAPAGPTHLWVATEPFWYFPNWDDPTLQSTEIRIREIAVAPGETRANPEPLTGSGPIAPSSTLGLEVPSCFPQQGATVHWYSHVAGSTLFTVQGDVPAPIAIFDARGQELSCAIDTSNVALGAVTSPGETMVIAVESPTAIGHLTLGHANYTGVTGSATDLGVTFPGAYPNFPEPWGMAVGTSEIFLLTNYGLLSFAKTGGVAPSIHGEAEGLGTAQLGYDIAFGAGKLFSLKGTESTTVHRLWSVHDEATSLWGPTPWDVPSAYPEETPLPSLTYDGETLVLASWSETPGAGVQFFTIDPLTPSPAVHVGTNLDVHNVSAIAADAAYFYVIGLDEASIGGIFRIDRANPSAPAFRLAIVAHDEVDVGLAVDDSTAANNLYAVALASRLRVVAAPAQAVPIFVGNAIPTHLRTSALTFDPSSATLYLYDDLFGRVLAVP